MTPPDPDPNPGDSGRALGRWMSVLAWVIALGLLTIGFGNLLDGQRNPNQDLATRLGPDGERQVRLFANRQGHYVATGEVNGVEAEFLLDTGATDVSVPQSVAERAGLRPIARTRVMTANGSIPVDVALIDTVALGSIKLRQVRATINPFIEEDVVLLGMAFLGQLELNQRDGVLTLKQTP